MATTTTTTAATTDADASSAADSSYRPAPTTAAYAASTSQTDSSFPSANADINSSTDSNTDDRDANKYRCVVLDTGAILKGQTGFTSTLHPTNTSTDGYYTVPGVLSEVRDVKSRQLLEDLPFELHVKEATKEGVAAMSEFARKTGDYRSLSAVDVQVLGLLYDLEKEGCNNDMSHVRTTPKRALGVGHIESLNPKKTESAPNEGVSAAAINDGTSTEAAADGTKQVGTEFFVGAAGAGEEGNADVRSPVCGQEKEAKRSTTTTTSAPAAEPPGKPKTWAMLVNPSAASAATAGSRAAKASSDATGLATTMINNVDLGGGQFDDAEEEDNDGDVMEGLISLPAPAAAPVSPAASAGGQFDDADEDEYDDEQYGNNEEDEDDDDEDLDKYIRGDLEDNEISDEECDVYILDPEELDERKRLQKVQEEEALSTTAASTNGMVDGVKQPGGWAKTNAEAANSKELNEELQSDFPSLAAASTIPYEGSDDDGDADDKNVRTQSERREEEAERRKQESLKPIVKTKDGKLYNSFRGYKHVVTSGGVAAAQKAKTKQQDVVETKKEQAPVAATQALLPDEKDNDNGDNKKRDEERSRILGGADAGVSGTMNEDDDDGEGWVTCVRDIRSMKATGSLDPSSRRSHDHHNKSGAANKQDVGPPLHQRAALATTDFAMQNVVLQMNLELLTLDGSRVRRLKSWVTRCGACFTVYGGDGKNSSSSGSMDRRLFCERCGSDALQRVAASVDRKTGRLKLHLSKRYKNNLRGTKFSLPKPGKGNRFEGDLLLREDQLLMGAWQQKVKKGSGGAARSSAGQSMFGSDLAANVGCHADLTKRDDIKVGFGRKNPNASKFGRERRGKKKKSTDKACGLRRY